MLVTTVWILLTYLLFCLQHLMPTQHHENVTDTSVTHCPWAKFKFRGHGGIKIWPLLDNGNLKIQKSPYLEMTLTMIKYCL